MNPLMLIARLVVDVIELALAGFIAWYFVMLGRVLWVFGRAGWRQLRGDQAPRGFEILPTSTTAARGRRDPTAR